MKRGGNSGANQRQLVNLLNELRTADDWLDNDTLKKIVSYGQPVVPHLEEILKLSLKITPSTPQTASNQIGSYAVLHVLFILAHLRSESSLPVVLEFLSQKPDFLDCYLHDSLLDEIWEVVFWLGANHILKLEKFILNPKNNTLSRLAVCTALIQIALHHPARKTRVTQVFKELLNLKKDDPDFVGLMISELLDLKSAALRPHILAALERNKIWSGIISAEDIRRSYMSPHLRKLAPTDLFARYRLYTRFARVTSVRKIQRRDVEKSW